MCVLPHLRISAENRPNRMRITTIAAPLSRKATGGVQKPSVLQRLSREIEPESVLAQPDFQTFFISSLTFLDHPNKELDCLPMPVFPLWIIHHSDTPPPALPTSGSLTTPAAALHAPPPPDPVKLRPCGLPPAPRNLCPNLG